MTTKFDITKLKKGEDGFWHGAKTVSGREVLIYDILGAKGHKTIHGKIETRHYCETWHNDGEYNNVFPSENDLTTSHLDPTPELAPENFLPQCLEQHQSNNLTYFCELPKGHSGTHYSRIIKDGIYWDEYQKPKPDEPKRIEGWINLYKDGFGRGFLHGLTIYENKEDANLNTNNQRIACIKISFVEGEGL